MGYLVRHPKDGAEGWMTSTVAKEVHEWQPKYKVLKTVPLTGGLAASEAADTQEVFRLLEAGELVECNEPPCEDVTTNFLRVRCTTVTDKTAGWATVRESGILMLRPATEAELSDKPAAADAEEPKEEEEARGVKRPAPWERASRKGQGKGK